MKCYSDFQDDQLRSGIHLNRHETAFYKSTFFGKGLPIYFWTAFLRGEGMVFFYWGGYPHSSEPSFVVKQVELRSGLAYRRSSDVEIADSISARMCS